MNATLTPTPIYTGHHSLTLKFAYPWRPEQQRILANLHHYINNDKRLHIVAAPGAGKTAIGLEIFNRLQLKALVISSTSTVRDQWVKRLSTFLPVGSGKPNWCSTSIKQPEILTATTYQDLSSFFNKRLNKKQQEKNHTASKLNNKNLKHWLITHKIGLLILDEAHHLKANCWQLLMQLVTSTDELIIVSLTATPPYDTNTTEWARYQQLCGPVDEEISIPELVRSNALCPHQDYLWMVETNTKNITSFKQQQDNLTVFISNLEKHTELLYLLQLHQWLHSEYILTVKEVLNNLDEAFALLALLKQQKQPLPNKLLTILEKNETDIQPLGVFGWEVLLQSFLDRTHYPTAAPITLFRETLTSLLNSKHFLKYNRVSLNNSQHKLQICNKTQKWIKACFEITKVEYAHRQEWMRLIILSDSTRDEKDLLALNGLEAPIGASPIFHYLIHQLATELAKKTVLLTKQLSIIHQDILPILKSQLPPQQKLISNTYSEYNEYVVLKMTSEHLLPVLTTLHKTGHLQILISPHNLLGESLDTPHVNSLILATQTGSYVTTNQLRGLAIRIDPENKLKTASIWHIITVAPRYTYKKNIINNLQQRFKTFAGIHATDLHIESGIERLGFQEIESPLELETSTTTDKKQNTIRQSNQMMIKRLHNDRYTLQTRWQNSLEKAEKQVFQVGLQTKIRKSRKWNAISHDVAAFEQKRTQQQKIMKKSTTTFSLLIGMGLLSIIANIINPNLMVETIFLSLLGLGFSAFIITKITNKKLNAKLKTDNNYNPYSPLKFAHVILTSLRQINIIKTQLQPAEKEITISEIKTGYFRFSLNRFTRKENDTFLTALSQLLEPICQPRYILALKKNPSADDIIPVPHILGSHRNHAEIFLTTWQQYFPIHKKVRLISTTSGIGQAYLLKAKIATYEHTDDTDIRLIDRWE